MVLSELGFYKHVRYRIFLSKETKWGVHIGPPVVALSRTAASLLSMLALAEHLI